jgi:hypothetical protein
MAGGKALSALSFIVDHEALSQLEEQLPGVAALRVIHPGETPVTPPGIAETDKDIEPEPTPWSSRSPSFTQEPSQVSQLVPNAEIDLLGLFTLFAQGSVVHRTT